MRPMSILEHGGYTTTLDLAPAPGGLSFQATSLSVPVPPSGCLTPRFIFNDMEYWNTPRACVSAAQ
jgi:hypothetical protein